MLLDGDDPLPLAHAFISPLDHSASIARSNCRDHSGLMPSDLTTLPHFSVSRARREPKSFGDPGRASPISAGRACSFGSERPALISRLSLPTISGGVFLGAPTPKKLP